MADSGSIRAGRAFVELFADSTALQRGLIQAQAKLRAWGQAMTAIGQRIALAGSAALAPMLLGARQFAAGGSALWDLSQRTGASVEGLSRLENAAKLAGGGLSDIEGNITGLQHTLVALAEGATEPAYALSMLGTSFAELKRLAPEDQLALIAERMQRIASPVTRGTIASRLGLSANFGNIAAQMGAGGQLGATTAQDAFAAKQAQVAWNALQLSLGKLWTTVGAALAPALTKLANSITRIIVPVRDWLDKNRGLVVGVAALSAGVVAAGIALTGFGYAAKLAGVALGFVATGIGLVSGAIGLLLSPLGLVVGGLVALGYAWLTMTNSGRQFSLNMRQGLVQIGRDLSGLKNIASETWSGIVDAVKAGDLELAGQIAMEGLKAAWYEGMIFLTKQWFDLKDMVTSTWDGICNYIAERWNVLKSVLNFKEWTEFFAFAREYLGLGSKPGVTGPKPPPLPVTGPGASGEAGVKFGKTSASGEAGVKTGKTIAGGEAGAVTAEEAERRKRLKAMEEERNAALSRVKNLSDQARKAREARDQELRGAIPGIEAIKGRISTVGSFSGLAAWGQAGRKDFGEQIAGNTKLSYEVQRQILTTLQNQGPNTFS